MLRRFCNILSFGNFCFCAEHKINYVWIFAKNMAIKKITGNVSFCAGHKIRPHPRNNDIIGFKLMCRRKAAVRLMSEESGF